jgi:hypothetical protein
MDEVPGNSIRLPGTYAPGMEVVHVNSNTLECWNTTMPSISLPHCWALRMNNAQVCFITASVSFLIASRSEYTRPGPESWNTLSITLIKTVRLSDQSSYLMGHINHGHCFHQRQYFGWPAFHHGRWIWNFSPTCLVSWQVHDRWDRLCAVSFGRRQPCAVVGMTNEFISSASYMSFSSASRTAVKT